jgi:hypothetical protein
MSVADSKSVQEIKLCARQVAFLVHTVLCPRRADVRPLSTRIASPTLNIFDVSSALLFYGTEIGVAAGISSRPHCMAWVVFQSVALQLLVDAVECILMARGAPLACIDKDANADEH